MERRTLLLLGTAAVVSVGAALVLTPDGLRQRDTSPGTLAFEGLAPKLRDATRIEVRKSDATLVLLRQGEAWVLPDRGNYPVRPEKLREMLVGLTELRLVEARTADRAQLDRLGVDDPARPGSTAVLLRILGPQDQPIAELVVGRRRVRTQGNVPETIYVRRPAEAQAWLAEGRLAVDADPQLWVDRDIANFPQDRIRRVVVRRLGEPELVLGRGEGPEDKLRVTIPADPPPLDEVALDEVARSFEYLTFLDVKPEGAVQGTALGEARFELTEGMAVTVWPSREAETLWIRLRAEDGPDAAALNARWTGWAYQLGVWKEKAFTPRLQELLEREAAPETAPAR
ncbi:DUF4340 domain-containing protein [Paeniroseomonas aquatica]|uniref:DUF4340 domain-containing protein n=1 Tax=Paeniroseomonas aquatica TaxID=373043 RepID=A0ABT8A6U2_9PROT|nr:DUF4340 domain-containing protein [Paeniroseomonas aquatica]MDN3565398.1 DUF4340 domain-containing protein [Paeniroseomonas aquatica]